MATLAEYRALAEAGVPDGFGKQTFPAGCSFDPTGAAKLWVVLITPVIHYTLGGLKVLRALSKVDGVAAVAIIVVVFAAADAVGCVGVGGQ